MIKLKYFKYGFYSVIKKPLFNMLIILELAAILVVGNMAIAAYNSRSAFYEPYKDILTQDGFVFIGKGLGGYDQDLTIKNMCDSFEGDVTVINNYGFQILTNDDWIGKNVVSIDSRIFSKLKLPVVEGRWANSEKTENGEIEAVIFRGKDKDDERARLGSVIEGKINDKPCKLKIVGVIAEEQYVPSLAANLHINNIKGSVMNFYNVPLTSSSCSFFVSSSADEILSDPHFIAMTFSFMYYNSPPSDDIRQRNQEQLMANSKHLSPLSEYNKNSLDYINEQYIKLLPILICVFVIVLAELICSVAMNTRSQMRNYGIYFLCGCRWKDCLKISLSYSLIILIGGCIVGTAAFLVFQNSEYAAMFEQNLAMNNIYITLIIAAVILILSLVIPFMQIHKTSPVETIKEN